MVLFSWAVSNGMETISVSCMACLTGTLERKSNFGSFQDVQKLSAIQAAIRFLPNVITGIVNSGTGLLVHRLQAKHLVLVSSILSAGSPWLMTILNPDWSWWYCAFWALLLGPLSADGNPAPFSFHQNEVVFVFADVLSGQLYSPSQI